MSCPVLSHPAMNMLEGYETLRATQNESWTMYIKPACEVVPLLAPSLMSKKSLANTYKLELSIPLFTIQHRWTQLCEDTCYYFTSSSLALPGSALRFLRYHICCMFVTTHELLTPIWSYQ